MRTPCMLRDIQPSSLVYKPILSGLQTYPFQRTNLSFPAYKPILSGVQIYPSRRTNLRHVDLSGIEGTGATQRFLTQLQRRHERRQDGYLS